MGGRVWKVCYLNQRNKVSLELRKFMVARIISVQKHQRIVFVTTSKEKKRLCSIISERLRRQLRRFLRIYFISMKMSSFTLMGLRRIEMVHSEALNLKNNKCILTHFRYISISRTKGLSLPVANRLHTFFQTTIRNKANFLKLVSSCNCLSTSNTSVKHHQQQNIWQPVFLLL